MTNTPDEQGPNFVPAPPLGRAAPTDTPTPERVTLTAAEGEVLRRALTSVSPMSNAPATVERILAAREQALREEIAGQIEAYARSHKVTSDWGNLYNDGVMHGLNVAARIARGGTR